MSYSLSALNAIMPKLDTFESTKVEWLVKNLIPIGAITLMDGNPGCGKSNIVIDLAARLSVSRNWIDGSHIPEGATLVIDCENNPGRSTRPRLLNCDGDVSQIRVMKNFQLENGGHRERFRMPDHFGLLEEGICRFGFKLVIIDTIFNHMGRLLKANGDQDVREILTPLAEMAERLNVAIVLLRHLNKSAMGPALYRGSGSIAFNGVARSVIFCGTDPNEKTRQVMAHVKSNEGPICPSFSYKIEGLADGSCRIAWGEQVEISADELAGHSQTSEPEAMSDKASEELQAMLASGPRPMEAILQEAKKLGISLGTLRRAKTYLKVRSSKHGAGEGSFWEWSLPSDRPFYTE